MRERHFAARSSQKRTAGRGGRTSHYEQMDDGRKWGVRTARVGTVTWKTGLDTLVAGLLGGGGAGCSGRALSATAGGGVGKRFFVDVAFVDMASEKVARIAVKRFNGRVETGVPSCKLISTVLAFVWTIARV